MKDLQRIRLEWCYLNEVITTQGDQSNRGSSTTDEDDDDKDKDNNEEEYKTDCVRMLQVQYPDRRITNLQNRVVRNVMRPQTMNQRVMLPQYWRPF